MPPSQHDSSSASPPATPGGRSGKTTRGVRLGNERGAPDPGAASHAMRIVVDAMGGDRAPEQTTAGAVLAARQFRDTAILLTGPEDLLRAELDRIADTGMTHPDRRLRLRVTATEIPNLRIVPASESIGMHESPVRALRAKKDSSINIGIQLVAQGEADAFVSAGNTGAVVVASSLGLGLIPGVQRPGIAVPVRAIDHTLITIDVGANIHCKPMHLLQYGIMATVFARDVLEIANPKVGLLNVGEEARKGTDLLRDTYSLLSNSELNFVGNVEAYDLMFSATCDIVVCEGFVGNVMLKTSESVAVRMLELLKREVRRNILRKIGFALCMNAFRAVRDCGDYAEYGGAPLLGIKGVAIISHGRSHAKAILNAIREARSFVRGRVNNKIAEAIRRNTPANTNTGR